MLYFMASFHTIHNTVSLEVLSIDNRLLLDSGTFDPHCKEDQTFDFGSSSILDNLGNNPYDIHQSHHATWTNPTLFSRLERITM